MVELVLASQPEFWLAILALPVTIARFPSHLSASLADFLHRAFPSIPAPAADPLRHWAARLLLAVSAMYTLPEEELSPTEQRASVERFVTTQPDQWQAVCALGPDAEDVPIFTLNRFFTAMHAAVPRLGAPPNLPRAYSCTESDSAGSSEGGSVCEGFKPARGRRRRNGWGSGARSASVS